jgi:propanediol dehydratase large subunit
MILTLVVPALALVAFEDPKPLSSTMEGVTLYASAALVHRTARVTDDGKWVIEGLPSAVDDTNVRVRMTSGEVIGVEVRARERITSANERVEALRKDLLTLQREQKGADDEASVLRAMGEHLGALLRAEEQAHRGELAQGRVNEAAWGTNYAWLASKLSENRSAITP